ncbi:MAG TPA: hypothetical protein VNY05_04965 [Candidatus Acidoferrales bacterium]|jgi:hypothetical protein|nr:hypothetical protein [Candidatus Acidoferrales bacterium]
MKQNPNFAITEAVALRLGPLLRELVFVGGCATGLLITDPASAPVRVTRDVDVIAELASYAEYARLSTRLRTLGFREDDAPGAPLCRWVIDDMRLDVMPTSGAVLGFTNRWYAHAIREATEFRLAPHLVIRLVTSPCFLATKLEAFWTRGRGDYTSHDFEDIVVVIDGRAELPGEIEASAPEVRRYLTAQFSKLFQDEGFRASLPGQFLPDDVSQSRIATVLARIRSIAAYRLQ